MTDTTAETSEASETPAADMAKSSSSDTVVDINTTRAADNPADKSPETPGETDSKAEQITIGEDKFSVDTEVAKHIADLTAKAAPNAPDDYQLTVPETIKDQVEPNADDPRWLALKEVAKEHNLSQDAVSAILASHYQAEADSKAEATQFHTDERQKMIAAFNDSGNLTDEAASKAAQGVADWAVSLLQGDIAKNPALADELAVTAQTAAGVQLLAALRSHTGEGHVPSGRDVSNTSTNPWATGKQFNLTKQGEIYRQDPALAKTLEQQARAA